MGLQALGGSLIFQILVTLGVTAFAAESARRSAVSAPNRDFLSSLAELFYKLQPHVPAQAKIQLADQLAVAIVSPEARELTLLDEAQSQATSAQVVDALLRSATEPMPPIPFTTFVTVDEARAWWEEVELVNSFGALTNAQFVAYGQHYANEVRRLTDPPLNQWVAAAQALAAGVPSPDTRWFIGLALVNAGMLNVPHPENYLEDLEGPLGLSWPDAWAYWEGTGLVAARPSSVTVPVPPGTITVPGAGAGAIDLSGLVGAIGGLAAALPVSLLGGMTAAANLTNAGRKRQHLDRLACQPTTALETLAQIARSTISTAGPLVLLRFQDDLPLVKNAVSGIITGLLTNAMPDKLVSPDNVDEVAFNMLLERTTFGATAHLVAQAAEMNANIKTLNTNMLAAFLADLAGYSRLAQAWLGQVEQVAIQPAMARRVNRIARARIPDINQLGVMYAKKEISPDKAAEALAESGYSDEWVDTFQQALFLDPRLGEIVRIAQFYALSISPETSTPSPEALRWLGARSDWLAQVNTTLPQVLPDWWWWYKLMKGGYEMTDVKVLVQVGKRAAVRREQTLFFNAILRLYRDGYIRRAEADELVQEGWGVGVRGSAFLDPITARMRAMDLQVEYNRKSMAASTIGRMLAKGFISEDEAIRLLEGQGMESQMAVARVVQAKLGLLPTRRLELPDLDDEDATVIEAGG